MSPNTDAAASKDASGTASAWPSMTRASIATPAASAFRRSSSTMPGAKSVASTSAPATAAATANAPVPAATSSTRVPAPMSSKRTASSANRRVMGTSHSS